MSSIFDLVTQQLGGNTVKSISQAIGAKEDSTKKAMGLAIPTLLGALARNASNQEGAAALTNALDKDHDGSILDALGGFLGSPGAGPGEGILKHVLGDRRTRVEAGVSRASGLDAGSVAKLMTTLAPLLMGLIGREKRRQNLDASGVAGLLDQGRQQVERQNPMASGILGALLDADGDGDVDMADLSKKGIGILGKLFGGR